jgi:SAM-dependent methyltransferase
MSAFRAGMRRWLPAAVMLVGIVACIVALTRLVAGRSIELAWRPWPLAIAVVSGLASNLFSAQSWREFLAGTSGERISFREALGQNGLVLVGKYVPGKIAGLAARVAANAPHASFRHVLGATMIEMLASLAAAGVVGGVLLAVPFDPRIAVAIAIAGIAIVWYADAFCRIAVRLCEPLLRRLRGQDIALRDLDRARLRAGIVHVFAQWLCLSAMVAAISALLIEAATPFDYCRLAGTYGVAVILGTAALLFPGGIGPREGAFVWMAGHAIGIERAFALALALRIATTLIDIVGALGYIYSRLPLPTTPSMRLPRVVLNLLTSLRFPGSARYWEMRYRTGGDSGEGSYGAEAQYKATFLNAFVKQHPVGSIIDFGCGDGNQLRDLRVPQYLGFDVSDAAIARCRERYAGDATKTFKPLREYASERGDVATSLDVLYHLVEDEVFDAYLRRLFDAARKWVIVYATNYDDDRVVRGRHVRHRKFTDSAARLAPAFRLIESPPRPRELEGAGERASFFVFERV